MSSSAEGVRGPTVGDGARSGRSLFGDLGGPHMVSITAIGSVVGVSDAQVCQSYACTYTA